MKFTDNLYWKTELSCDTQALAESSTMLDEWTAKNLPNNPDPLPDHFHIHDVYNNYNFFAYPLPGIQCLYDQVCLSFSKISPVEDMWIKAWVNVYNNNSSHSWHAHKPHTWLDYEDFEPVHASWHGIYCVVGDETFTTYKNTRTLESVYIPWEKNQLVFVENQEDWLHRSWKSNSTTPRITIAFNILHRSSIDPFRYANHWLPVIKK